MEQLPDADLLELLQRVMANDRAQRRAMARKPFKGEPLPYHRLSINTVIADCYPEAVKRGLIDG